jgi:ubiquitin carboxyl-terminal hydrolase 4/11/15
MYLSLAIPQYKKWTGDVFLVPADPQRPQIRVTLELPANASFKKLKQAVGELTGYDAKKVQSP